MRGHPRAVHCGALAALAFALAVPPAGALTREQARETALANHPALAAAAARARAGEGDRAQAGAWPNPGLELEVEGFGGDLPGTRRAESVLALTQSIELPGRRRARVAAAVAAADGSTLDLAVARLELVAEVDRRFAALAAAQERQRLAAADRATAAEMVATVVALVDAGQVSPIERVRAEAEQAMADLEHARALRELERRRRELALLLGAAGEGLEAEDGSVAARALPPLEAFAARLAARPELAQARAEVMRAEAEWRLARSERAPELSLSAGAKRFHESDETGFVAGIGLSLPLVDRRAGAVAAARARLDAARADLAAEDLRARESLAAAHAAYQQAAGDARALAEQVLPRSEEVSRALGEAYAYGKVSLLDVLESRRALIAARVREVESRLALAEAAAALERLLAAPLEAIEEEER